MSKKKSKRNPLNKEDKKKNAILSFERVINENVIGLLKRFKIIADRYRNRRKLLNFFKWMAIQTLVDLIHSLISPHNLFNDLIRSAEGL
jgi:hypothetical protein